MNNRVPNWEDQDYINELLEFGFTQEQIDVWAMYLKIDPREQPFDYLDDIILNVKDRDKLIINEINYLGGRNGKKTHDIVRFAIKLILLCIKYELRVAIYAFRELGADVQEFQKEFREALDEMNIRESANKTTIGDGFYYYKNPNNKPLFKFIGGSFIQLQGLNNSKNEKVALKGLASAKDFDLAISICEEANEIDNSEFQAVDAAVRGAKQYLKIKMSNPDVEFQDYVVYCRERFPQDRQLLNKYGQQFTIIKENGKRKLFHYTNYQINAYLSKDQVLDFLELKKLDPTKYEIWGLGMAGGLDTAVFSRYISEAANDDNFKPNTYLGGVDLGQSDAPTGHPTFAGICGKDSLGRIKLLAEYTHNNANMVHKEPTEIARDIVDFYVNFARQKDFFGEEPNYNMIKYGLNVNVDYGAGGKYMIDILNSVREKEYYNETWLYFQPVDKSVWYVKDRVDGLISMLVSKVFLLDRELTPETYKQLNLVQWKKPANNRSSHKLEIIDLNDDAFDMISYCIMPELKSTLNNIKSKNSLLAPKGSR